MERISKRVMHHYAPHLCTCYYQHGGYLLPCRARRRARPSAPWSPSPTSHLATRRSCHVSGIDLNPAVCDRWTRSVVCSSPLPSAGPQSFPNDASAHNDRIPMPHPADDLLTIAQPHLLTAGPAEGSDDAKSKTLLFNSTHADCDSLQGLHESLATPAPVRARQPTTGPA